VAVVGGGAGVVGFWRRCPSAVWVFSAVVVVVPDTVHSDPVVRRARFSLGPVVAAVGSEGPTSSSISITG